MKKIASIFILATTIAVFFLGIYFVNNILNHFNQERKTQIAAIFIPLPPPPPPPPTEPANG